MAVVVGSVATNEGRAALRKAADEAVRRHTRLVVVEGERADRRTDEDAEQQLLGERRAAEQQLDAAGVDHEVLTVADTGDAAADLLAVAEDVQAELIVIGLRRRSPVGKLILGSSAQRILLDASCAVLAVKSSEATG